MAAALTGVFPATLQEKVLSSKILVVGAGGIGCEILKNLVLSGFPDIEIIDLDTIDLSNLNRQFLFHREHVGKSKAEVARESALQFNPNVKIKAYHDSITEKDYGINFFKKFNVVLNALDNRAARNHVNRMCLNADVPLIESGTAGYNGQVELIKKGLTQCYECTPKAAQKSFPGCTIRNTPSEPIHCIVWAKHLFNQLFGQTVDDEDISPDMADPEAKDKNVEKDNNAEGNGAASEQEKAVVPDAGNVARINTRQWAKDANYDPATLFNKFFCDDINYLLSMANLWKTRKPPTPLQWDSVLMEQGDSAPDFKRQYHKIWSLAECGAVFAECLKQLRTELEKLPDESNAEGNTATEKSLVWDKDDQPAMDFVAACANIRAYIFEIARKSRFEVKSMAGNIIPAIATTNAITAGVVVLQAFKLLQGEVEKCKSVYMRLRQNPRQQLLVPEKFLTPPNPDCYVCAADPAIHIRVDTKKMRISAFRDDVLIKALNMINPDVMDDAKGVVIISSDEDETTANDSKYLSDMGIVDGALLKCDDFFQNYELNVIIIHFDAGFEESLFEVIADKTQLKPKDQPEEEVKPTKKQSNGSKQESPADDGPSTSKKMRHNDNAADADDDILSVEVDDDLVIVEDDDVEVITANVVDATDKLKVSSSPKKVDAPTEKVPVINITSSKRKMPATPEPIDEIQEILDSDEEDGPTQRKRAREAETVSNVVINID